MQATQKQGQSPVQVDEFFEAYYSSLLELSHSIWNGSGGDVANTAYLIMKKRYGELFLQPPQWQKIFKYVMPEAARDMGLFYITHDENGTILLPHGENNATRLQKELATPEDNSDVEISPRSRTYARRLLHAEKKTGQLNFWSSLGATKKTGRMQPYLQ